MVHQRDMEVILSDFEVILSEFLIKSLNDFRVIWSDFGKFLGYWGNWGDISEA